MLKMFVTDAVVSKGYNGAPALRFSDNGNGEIVRFRLGSRVYDKREKDNYRWLNLSVKAFGNLCERIKKMQLKEGSYVNLVARYDEETWEDSNTHDQKKNPVLIVEEIEYCVSGDRQNTGVKQSSVTPEPESDHYEDESQESGQTKMPDNFTGYEPFGSANPFFPEG